MAKPPITGTEVPVGYENISRRGRVPPIVGPGDGADADAALLAIGRLGVDEVKPYLDRMYELIDDHLSDPHTTRRLTPAKKYRDLEAAEAIVWTSLMRGSGQFSSLGRTEASYTLEDGKQHYLLPGNFRQFIRFERRNDSNPNEVTAISQTIPIHHPGPGLELLEAERGFLLRPVPDLSASEGDWVLIYSKGPTKGHTAVASSIAAQSIGLGTPRDGFGEVVTTDDYYKGSLIRIVDAELGAGQVREVTAHNATAGVCAVKHPWQPIPKGDVVYEFGPALPPPMDGIYALSVAISVAGRRGDPERRGQLVREFRENHRAAQQWMNGLASDRGPSRVFSTRYDESDPYD